MQWGRGLFWLVAGILFSVSGSQATTYSLPISNEQFYVLGDLPGIVSVEFDLPGITFFSGVPKPNPSSCPSQAQCIFVLDIQVFITNSLGGIDLLLEDSEVTDHGLSCLGPGFCRSIYGGGNFSVDDAHRQLTMTSSFFFTNGYPDIIVAPQFISFDLPDGLTLSSMPPTPLPATLPLFATGLGALGLLGWRRKRKQVVKLVGAVVTFALFIVSPAHCGSLSFENWTLFFNSSDNHLDSGPTLTTAVGSNSISAAFTNTVFNQNTPIAGFNNNGCVGLCSNFYYTLPMEFKVYSPSMNVVAGDTYAIQFHVDATNFNSTADYFIQIPAISFEYLSSNTVITGCFNCAISLVPNAAATFAFNFIPAVSGPISFGFDWETGRNPNGGASSSVSAFTESGFYQFSDFAITDLSTTPLPAALPLFASGGALLGFLGWRRKRKNAAALAV